MNVKLIFSIAILFSVGVLTQASESGPKEIRFGTPVCRSEVGVVSEAIPSDWINEQIRKINKNLTPAEKGRNTKIRKNGIPAVTLDKKILKLHQRAWTKVITSAGEVTNQGQSGDCWIHAATNTVKSKLIGMGLVKNDFQFSRNFFYFYSTLEKTNTYFQELINLKPDGWQTKFSQAS